LSTTKPETLFNTIIVRLGGEIGIKSAWTRGTYEKRLIQNIKATLKHYNIAYNAIFRQQGRIYIKTSQAQQAALKLTKAFGISSLSPASQTTSKLDDITTLALRHAKQKLRKQNTFAVKCKRVGKHPYTSREVCQQIGQKILEAYPELQPKVNLTSPDITIGIEIRETQAYVYTETIPASDGLPIGTQPKIVALIKPDLNSPVACWLTMKRGCPFVPVYLIENQNHNENAIKLVKEICKTLSEWSMGHLTKLYLVPHSQNLKTLKEKIQPHLVNILNKRLIYRITAQIAQKEKALGIVTGETIKEKPPYSLRHFQLQDQATRDYPIHRPLIGLTNFEIEKLAQNIGIQKVLTIKPEKPEVVKLRQMVLPTLKEVEAAESRLNIKEMIDKTTAQIETITYK
jgi:thiamine biosynthesis protein ThiI